MIEVDQGVRLPLESAARRNPGRSEGDEGALVREMAAEVLKIRGRVA